jgi:hypothetical protein
MKVRRFSRPTVAEIAAAKIIGIKAGLAPHRFLGIWVVTVNGRVFVRPWNDKPAGWYRTFRTEPRGFLELPARQLTIRVRPVRGVRLLDAVDRAYAEKYPTPGSRKYVRGFAVAKRRATTLELLPR